MLVACMHAQLTRWHLVNCGSNATPTAVTLTANTHIKSLTCREVCEKPRAGCARALVRRAAAPPCCQLPPNPHFWLSFEDKTNLKTRLRGPFLHEWSYTVPRVKISQGHEFIRFEETVLVVQIFTRPSSLHCSLKQLSKKRCAMGDKAGLGDGWGLPGAPRTPEGRGL
jgi:hypothetical protein